MKKLIVLATCLAVMFAPAAHAAGVDDPDDTAGRLDIKYLGAHIVGDRLEFEVEMYQRWPNRLFWLGPEDHGGPSPRGQLAAFFNTSGGRQPEFFLWMEHADGRWKGHVCPVADRDDGNVVRCKDIRVWRSEPESIEFSVKADQLLAGDADGSYTWRVKSKLTFDKGCPDSDWKYCVDRAHGKQAD